MKKLFILVSILNLLIYSSMIGNTCDTNNIITASNSTNYKYLRYFYFMNFFGDATVSNMIGEFRIEKPDGFDRIHIPFNILDDSKEVSGQNEQGEDLVLREICKTEPFIITSNRISFFRMMTAQINCGGTYKGGDKNGTGNPFDVSWIVGKNSILDNSCWKIELLSFTTGERLYLLDSAGVGPNPDTNSALAFRYGTTPDLFNITRTLPDDLVGMIAYIRITPVRTGTTPFGMKVSLLSNMVNYSSYLEREPSETGYSVRDSIFWDVAYRRYRLDMIYYCDSVKNATGRTPSDKKDYCYFKGDDVAMFHQRYGYSEIFKGHLLWIENEGPILMPPLVKTISNPEKGEYIYEMPPMPKTGIRDKLSYHASCNHFNSRITIYDINGEIIKELWKGDLCKGDNEINLDYSFLSNGQYRLCMQNHVNKILDNKWIMVEK